MCASIEDGRLDDRGTLLLQNDRGDLLQKRQHDGLVPQVQYQEAGAQGFAPDRSNFHVHSRKILVDPSFQTERHLR